MFLLVVAALAAPPAARVTDDILDLDDDLPVPPYAEPGSAAWIGVSVPMFGRSLERRNPWWIGFDANAHFRTRVPWLSPEVRLGVENPFDLTDPTPIDRTDKRVVLTAGTRFGHDRGLYGGAGVGAVFLWNVSNDWQGWEIQPAITVYGGFAYPAGEHVRVGPEVMLGTRNTLSLRVEWGV